MLALLIAAHLAGDFFLQNNWMSANKARSHWVCAVHVATYLTPFCVLALLARTPWAVVGLIGAQHYLQDRYALHLRWMKFYRQTPPDLWPVGPLCVDQTIHIAWMAIVTLIIS
jgi:hypothetical protein